MCFFFLLYSPLRLSFVSAVFDFNDSLNDITPTSPILLSVHAKRKIKKRIVDGCHLYVFFLLPLPLRMSSVNVVFDFSDSLNDAAPLSPIQLSVYEKRKEKE